MSLHRSLKTTNRLTRARNVLRRGERVEQLEKDERWTRGQSIFGLPKIRVKIKSASRGKKKAAEQEAEAPPSEEAPAEGTSSSR